MPDENHPLGKLQDRQDKPAPDLGLSRFIGGIGLGVTLVFLMGLVIAEMRGASIPRDARTLVAVIAGMAAAFTVGFGAAGTIDTKGEFPIPFFGGKTLQFTASGAVAGFIVVFALVLVSWRFYDPNEKPVAAAFNTSQFDLAIALDDATTNTLGGAAELPDISFRQLAPVLADERQLAFQIKKHTYRAERATLPPLTQTFDAYFVPVVRKSAKVADAMQVPFRICFQRKGDIPGDSTPIELAANCSPTRSCLVQSTAWVSDCEATTGWLEWLSPERKAWADSASTPRAGWRVPSLQTLKQLSESDPDAPAYTIFSLSAAQPLSIAGDSFSYLIVVNGTPVFVDGWSPDEMRLPLSRTPINLEFALQNLDFSGSNGGYERLSVTFFVYKDGRRTGQISLTRSYIALRDAEKESLTASDGTPFSWEGLVVPAKRQDKFSIFLGATNKGTTALQLKQAVDKLSARLGAGDAVAVVRPPLKPWRLQPYENPHWAVLLGIRASTGQIRFTFDEGLADDLCTTVYNNLPQFHGVVPKSVYRFEWPSVGKNPKATPCATIVAR